MSESTNHSRRMIVLSILSPVLIFLVGMAWIFPQSLPLFSVPEELPPRVEEIQQRFEDTQPQVIIAGSSIANKAVDEVGLANELGLPEDDVQKLWSGRATIGTIMLMIQQRVLQQELKPKLILVFATPAWMLTNTVIDQKEFDMHWTGAMDPTLQEVLNLKTDWTRSYSKKQSETQDRTQQFVRHWFGERLFGLSEAEVQQQFDSLFDFENQRTDSAKQQQIIQHNLHDNDSETSESGEVEWAVVPPEDKRLVYSLVEQVRAKGINIVLVEMPVAKSIKELHQIPEAVSLEVIQKYSALEAGHLYYFDWEEKDIFSDMHHMNQRGRTLFTKMLADDLQKMNALGENMVYAELPKELTKPELRWSSEVGTLQKGESLDIEFKYPWQDLIIEVCVSGRRKPARPMLSIGDTQLTVQKNWGTEVWCEQAIVEQVKQGDVIHLNNERSIEMHVHRVRLNQVELLEKPLVLKAEKDIQVLTSGEHPPASITEKQEPPPWLQKNKEKHPSLLVGKLAQYSELTDGFILKKQIPWQCSPLEAVYQGESLRDTVSLCKHILNDPQTGDNCFVSQWWLSFNRAELDWSQLQVQLQEERRCTDPKKKHKHYWWVYPGDSIRWSFGFLRGHYALLRLMGTSIGTGKWRVQVKNEHRVFLDTTIDGLDFKEELSLDIPVRRKMNPNVVVEISAVEGEDNYLFVRGVELDN